MSFVKGVHNHISDALSRSPVWGSGVVEGVLRRLRNVPEETKVSGEISGEVSAEVHGDQEKTEVDGEDPGLVSAKVSGEEQ